MTEADAILRWCPFAASRSAQYGAKTTAFIIDGESAPRTTCVASSCMAWRWDVRSAVEKLSQGHCGLAGAA
jgi:hypothetical protein